MSEPVDVLEALLFASDAPVEAERIQEVLDLESRAAARELVDALRQRLDAEGRALQVMEAGGGFRLVTRPEMAPVAHQAPAQQDQEPALARRARGARHRGVSPAGVAPRGGRRARRQFRGRARQPPRPAHGADRRAEGFRGPPVPLRDHPRVPRRLRPARPERPAQGRRRAHRARSLGGAWRGGRGRRRALERALAGGHRRGRGRDRARGRARRRDRCHDARGCRHCPRSG